MNFVNVSYLWGILGILIPIAIHLWSRKKVITIKVGSIKLLQASEPKQSSSIKINEWLLLALRILTILLLAFIVAEPSISTKEKPSNINYVIAPSLIDDDDFKTILDTLPSHKTRLLVDGFPLLEEYKKEWAMEVPSYWQLAEQMHTIPADSIVVFSRGYQKGVHGKRPTIQANTHWINLATNTTTEKTVGASLKSSYIELLNSMSSEYKLSFKKDSISFDNEAITLNKRKDSLLINTEVSKEWLPLHKSESIRIAIIQKDSLGGQLKFIKAAFRAISKFLNRPLEMDYFETVDQISNLDLSMLVILDSIAPQPTEIPTLLFKQDSYANELIEKGPRKNLYFLTAFLDSENIVSEHLPQKLMELLQTNSDLTQFVLKHDDRVVAEKELQPIASKKDKIQFHAKLIPLNFWLWMALIAVVITERLIAKVRKQ